MGLVFHVRGRRAFSKTMVHHNTSPRSHREAYRLLSELNRFVERAPYLTRSCGRARAEARDHKYNDRLRSSQDGLLPPKLGRDAAGRGREIEYSRATSMACVGDYSGSKIVRRKYQSI